MAIENPTSFAGRAGVLGSSNDARPGQPGQRGPAGPGRVSAASGPFHQGVAGVGFEPTQAEPTVLLTSLPLHESKRR
jgi:hypothetical protein